MRMAGDRGGGWYPLMLSADLEPGTVAGCILRGRELAVWRDGAGQAHVWDDRCPHRGMRLSLGFVREGTLACLYHGWRFGAGGRCVHIPAHPDLTPAATIRAAPLRAVERHGLVWTAPEDGESSAPQDDPAMDAVEWTPVRSLRIDAPWGNVATAIGMPDGCRVAVLDRDVAGPVLAAILPVDGARCMLHLLAGGPADRGGDRGRLHDLADWAQDVCRRMEETA
ncbi:Rieske (2Fe-2S) protein [Gluconacetobacter diazotrophicus]|uniref:Rieske (2Fe-2S) protein n=2 Tax=Gluconacetobacter diazotrophicus TaxID=33996 RepID=A0A7W4FCY5_GLUDI|nr:Rieske (2Fe-2S) protein [Gluconacetobacter diazotrophicus]